MTFMSPNRLVTQRCLGLPLMLLKSIGQPPSNCFWMPVISRSGLTSLSVSIRSPSFLSHSMAPRRSLVSSGDAPTSFLAFAIAILQNVVRKNCISNIARKRSSPQLVQVILRPNRIQIRGEFSDSGCLDGVYAYMTFPEKSTQPDHNPLIRSWTCTPTAGAEHDQRA